MFQFTHPGRGATHLPQRDFSALEFQFTHPGRGATYRRCLHYSIRRSFNSRTPGGVRRFVRSCSDFVKCFNSRTPGGVRLAEPEGGGGGVRVSIHAPREGCDWNEVRTRAIKSCFNSRTPGGVRQCGAKLRIMGRINKRNLRLAVLL